MFVNSQTKFVSTLWQITASHLRPSDGVLELNAFLLQWGCPASWTLSLAGHFVLRAVLMNDDRRTAFRALLMGTREASLIAAGQSLRVRIVEESSGGLCVATDRECPYADGTTARLNIDDGDVSTVQVMHRRTDGRRTFIGLQRVTDQAPHDLHERRGTRPLILLVGLTLGLYAGLAFRFDALREFTLHMPGLAKILVRN